jgi:hypothetical protein
MSSDALFGLSILMSFLAFAIVTKVYIWPRLRVMRGTDALIPLVVPHTFRFVGLSFLIPGVVSPSLSPPFAIPAAYGDLVAAILAGVATLALAARASWAQSTSCTQSTKAKSAWALPLDRWERRFSSRQSLSHRYSLRMGSYFGCCCGQSNEAARETSEVQNV